MLKWFSESQTNNITLSLRIKAILYEGESNYQKIAIYDTYDYGRLLALDDKIMLTERDEFIYHEMISHVSLYSHPLPTKVLVIGGGDGGTVREVLKHNSVIEVHLCEIDELVVSKSREFFSFYSDIPEDYRLKILYEDGFKFLEGCSNLYDVILIDSTDPIGEAVKLFSLEFIYLCKSALKKDGILTFQSESPFYNIDFISKLRYSLNRVFKITKLYTVNIPSYPSGFWSFMISSDIYDPTMGFREAESDKFRYYNSDIHKGAFILPSYVKNMLINHGKRDILTKN